MRFLVDENVPNAVVAWLRDGGHDVLSAAETHPGETDANWLTAAEAQGRLIVTSDKDFGELIFRERRNSHGVILLRLEALAITERVARLSSVWGVIEANPSGRFVVVTEHRIRVRRLA